MLVITKVSCWECQPACLKCHGSTNDINEETLEIIQARYPSDRATNYQLGDFRGSWKIQFKN